MEQVAREDIAAAAAARRELGSSYDDAFADSLIERIGTEIDKRVDARLASRRQYRRIDAATLERRRTLWKGAAIGATVAEVPVVLAALASRYSTKGVIVVVILTWALIAAGYGISTLVHALRQNGD